MSATIALLASRQDPAGLTIYRILRENFGFVETAELFDAIPVCGHPELRARLYLLEDQLLTSDNLENKIEADVFLFLSKHRSGSDTRSFAVHSIGNWDTAVAGGKDKMLCPAAPQLMGSIFSEMSKRAEEKPDYEITMEATHHGPFTTKPAIFVEVGSTEAEWKDESNAIFLAGCVLEGIKNAGHRKTALGIGGPHYCRTFNKLSARKEIAFGHVCPKHHLDTLDVEMMKQAIEKSGSPDMVILDWKGLGPEKRRIVELLDRLGLQYERSDGLLKN